MRQDHPMTPGVLDARQQQEPGHPGRRAVDAATVAQKARATHDYAVEHAEYMAKSAERLIAAIDDMRQAEAEATDITEIVATVDQVIAADEKAYAAHEALNEGIRTLQDHIYQFRKRADRAAAAPQPAEQQPEYGDAYQGARTDVAIWKRRALEAEQRVREQDQIIDRMGEDLNAINGPTFMGEPVLPKKQPEPDVTLMAEALEFYANGDHLIFSDENEWDTVSGEPQNWLCDAAGTAAVETGCFAKAALAAYRKGGDV